MVRFRDGEPTGIYYSQHSSGAAYSWNDTGLSLRDGRALELSKVLRLLKKLRCRKASGPDTIANEALKLLADIIAPYLRPVFQACMLLSYHPAMFKAAEIVMLPKPGKTTMKLPNS